MNHEENKLKHIPFIRELCIDKTEEGILEAEENFREYLLVIKEMCDRIGKSELSVSDFDD